MEIRGLAFLPILWVTWTLLGFCALIALTIIQGHQNYPYISDTGARFPESVVYTVIFILSSILGAGVAVIQYRFMIIHSEPSEKRHIIGQKILLTIGWIGCIGNAVNAVYSVKTNRTAHNTGAGLAFSLYGLYNLCQSICLYKKSLSSRRMCHVRLASTLVTIVALLIFAVCMIGINFQLWPNNYMEVFIMTGMAVEWIGFFGLNLHNLTYYTDFQRLSLKLSRKGVSICLREKTEDPENP